MPLRSGPVAVALLLLSTTEPLARADDDVKKHCARRALEGQQHEDAARLRAAQAAFAECSQDQCPPIVAADCRRWLAELDRDIPSIVFFAGGRLPSESDRVWIDDELVPGAFEGKPVQVDPGVHRFRFFVGGHRSSRDLVIREGEQNRRIDVDLPRTGPNQEAPRSAGTGLSTASTPTPASVYVLSAIGTVALGTAVYFGASAFSRRSDLKDCKPTCDAGDVDAVRTRFLAADIAGTVGIVALSASLWIYLDASSGLRVGGVHEGGSGRAVLTGTF